MIDAPILADLEAIVTGRARSHFHADMEAHRAGLQSAIGGRRILVIGGGGSIGSATTRALIEFRPAAVHVVDISENYLAELVRELRSADIDLSAIDLQTHVLDYGAPVMRRFLAAMPAFDAVLNFAAVKHVRSEKDVYSLLHMLDVNIVRQWKVKRWLAESGHAARYFTVSTDKAANPSSLMGASKRVMEDVAFDVLPQSFGSVTSARFANVAFSNGSLLQSFVVRLQKRQPLAVPRDTRRYFISHAEAAEICLLSAFAAPAGFILVPAFDPAQHLLLLEDVADRVVRAFGFEPSFVADEATAKHQLATDAGRERWPVVRTPLDTSGEKAFEEFVADDEHEERLQFTTLRGIRHGPSTQLEPLLRELEFLVEDADRVADRDTLIRLVGRAVPLLRHVDSERHLDQRM